MASAAGTATVSVTRLAHLSDLHLGERSTVADVETLTRTIVRGGYDAVLLAGDIFDRSWRDAALASAVEAMFAEWSGVGIRVAITAGNHDAEVGVLDTIALPSSVALFAVDQAQTVRWDDLGVAVHGRSIGRRDEGRDLAPGYPDPVPGLHNLGMLHTSLDGSRSKRACAPTSLAALEERGYDYWALGHVHEQVVLDARGTIAYSGSVTGAGGHPRVWLDLTFAPSGVALRPRTA